MSTSKHKAARAVVLLAVLFVVALSWLPSISTEANAYVDQALKNSLVTFASARALNGVISVVQGTEVAV